jgi:hypothetical protein
MPSAGGFQGSEPLTLMDILTSFSLRARQPENFQVLGGYRGLEDIKLIPEVIEA